MYRPETYSKKEVGHGNVSPRTKTSLLHARSGTLKSQEHVLIELCVSVKQL